MPEKTKRNKGKKRVFDNSFSLLISVNNYNFYPGNFVHHKTASGHYN